MNTILLIIGAAALIWLARPAPRRHVIYMPVEVAEARGRLGCLPILALLVVALVIVLVSGGKL